ncbi:unnamed protein product [Trichogramma brassicae]|uniref:RNA-directed DNA polymerase n=1 Tax=Trichogramma brassicae TaxID=86971 RepID=A0A6H5IMU2_9HYME|nr:unnamed protein product [Trichogramma brassicae]
MTKDRGARLAVQEARRADDKQRARGRSRADNRCGRDLLDEQGTRRVTTHRIDHWMNTARRDDNSTSIYLCKSDNYFARAGQLTFESFRVTTNITSKYYEPNSSSMVLLIFAKIVEKLATFPGSAWLVRQVHTEQRGDEVSTLLNLTRKNAEWISANEQQRAFEALKKALTEAPVLVRPDFARPFILQCDASAFAIGGVLSQVFNDGEHPIVYVSRVLTSAERNYMTSEKECLALLWTIRKLRPYLEGYKFIAMTDHSRLQYLRNLKDLTGRLARWALEMQQWEFEIVHLRGKVHELPDALSRAYETNEGVCVAGVSDESDEEHQRLVQDIMQNPQRWQNCAGHLGIKKTFDRVKREYYWRGMYHNVHKYVRSCDTCQRYKIDQTSPRGRMGPRVIERLWAVITCDLMEFPLNKRQNKYLIVFIDLSTRWVELKPVRRATGKAVASALEELVLFRWKTPNFLICDNGKEQVNKNITAVLDAYGIRQVTTAPYTPRMNPTERANRTIKTMITAYVGANHRDWDKHLHELRHAMNTAVQSSTRVSPAFLNYGRHPRPVKSWRREVEAPTVGYWEIDETVWLDRISRLDAICDLVKHLDKAHEQADSSGEDEARRGPTANGFQFPQVAEIPGSWSEEDWNEGVDEGAFLWPAPRWPLPRFPAMHNVGPTSGQRCKIHREKLAAAIERKEKLSEDHNRGQMTARISPPNKNPVAPGSKRSSQNRASSGRLPSRRKAAGEVLGDAMRHGHAGRYPEGEEASMHFNVAVAPGRPRSARGQRRGALVGEEIPGFPSPNRA